MSEAQGSEDPQANSDKNLQSIVLEGWQGYEELEETSLPFNSKEYQDKVKTEMARFEAATRFINQIGLFSPNELIDEVSTDSLQYLLLPFFLGKLSLKLQKADRGEVLHIAEVYFNDYLQRCQEYELCNERKKSGAAGENSQSDSAEGANKNELAQLLLAAHARNDKIAQFKQKKELEEHIKLMKAAVRNKTVDDEIRREFFLKFLKKSIIDANEELDSIKLEKQMVEMGKMRMSAGAAAGSDEWPPAEFANNTASPAAHSSSATGHAHHHHGHHGHQHQGLQQPKRKPMQPFIITRNAAQKAVFGAGYPSLPVLTVDEFYEQRVREGIFPDEEKVAKMNRDQAIAAAQDPNEKEDMEKAAEQQQVEDDDPEYLARMRRMDEYKDVVRRGDGNRYNRS